MSKRLENKNIVVTAAGQGIGRATAIAFHNEGAKVIATDINDKTLETLNKEYPNIKVKKFDMAEHSRIEEFIENVVLELGGLDILINNAGITGPTAELWNYSINDWNKVAEINLNGTFNCCKSIVPNMIKNNYGRIVNIASVAGKDGNANASAYSSAKAAVIGLTKSLGKEVADKNIAVNCVTPAAAKTRIFDQMTKEHIDYMLSKVPRNRFLEVDELASLVAWLASEENSFSLGAVFDISGGRATY